LKTLGKIQEFQVSLHFFPWNYVLWSPYYIQNVAYVETAPESHCFLSGPAGNLPHCRVSAIKTIKVLPGMVALFETIVKQCDFE
jgi:hypothetical protein